MRMRVSWVSTSGKLPDEPLPRIVTQTGTADLIDARAREQCFFASPYGCFTLLSPRYLTTIVKNNDRPMRKIAVLLVDDHTVVRQGLRALLAAAEDIEVIGEAENGRQTVMQAKKTLPDFAVMVAAMAMLYQL